MPEDQVIEADRPAEGGIRFENTRSSLKPPPDPAEDGGPVQSYGPPAAEAAPAATVALDPRILKFSLGAIGQAVANITGYPDWAFSADQLEAISDSLTELELTLSPVFNCVLISVSILAGKSVAYVMWVRAGKPPIPGSSKKLMDQGQQEFEDDVLPELEK